MLNAEAAGSGRSFGLFGEVESVPSVAITSDPVMYGWQGLRYDAEIALWDNLARSYHPNVGAFLTQDPLGMLSGESNFYGSRKNNAQKYLDANGKLPIIVVAIVGAALVQGTTSAITTYVITGSASQAAQAGMNGAVAGGLAGFLIVAGGVTVAAALAAVAVDVGYNLLNGPFGLNDPKDFMEGLSGIVNYKNRCAIYR